MLLSLLTATALASEAPPAAEDPWTAPAWSEPLPAPEPWSLDFRPRRWMPLPIGPELGEYNAILVEQAWWLSAATVGLGLSSALVLSDRSGVDGYLLGDGAWLLSGLGLAVTVPMATISSALAVSAGLRNTGYPRDLPYLGLASLGMVAAGASRYWNGHEGPLPWALIAASPVLAFAQVNLTLAQSHPQGTGAGGALTLHLAQGLTLLAVGSGALLWAGYGASEANLAMGGATAAFALPVLVLSGVSANLLFVGHSLSNGRPVLLGLLGGALAIVGGLQAYDSEGADWLTAAGMLTLAPVVAGAQWAKLGEEARIGVAPTEGGAMAGMTWRF